MLLAYAGAKRTNRPTFAPQLGGGGGGRTLTTCCMHRAASVGGNESMRPVSHHRVVDGTHFNTTGQVVARVWSNVGRVVEARNSVGV